MTNPTVAGADGLHLENGTGGRGGTGGQGGHGGGVDGEPGYPGNPGEPGNLSIVSKDMTLRLSITALLAVLGVATSGAFWFSGELSKIELKINEVRRDGASFRENVLSLNTPLSQRVFSVEARVLDVSRIQAEVRASIADMDANGTSPNKLLRREVELLRSDLAGLNTRCQDSARKLDSIHNDTLENKLRIQNIIEALTPHDSPRRGPK